MTTGSEPAPSRHGPVVWIAVAAGWLLIGRGIWGVFAEHAQTNPTDLARWFLGLVLVHDLVVAPLVFAVAAGVGAVTPRTATVVRAALATTALAALLAWPLVRRYGERSGNPTLLPLDYPTNLVGIVAAVWIASAIAIAIAIAARRRHGRGRATR